MTIEATAPTKSALPAAFAETLTPDVAPTVDPDSTICSVPPADTLRASLGALDPSKVRHTSLLGYLERATDASAPARYELGPILGKGGMGTVLHAIDRDLARRVALKVLRADAPNADQVSRFLREAQVTAQLEHPGIVPVHDIGLDESGRFYYVMRLVRGEVTLRQLIDRLRAGDAEAHRTYTIPRRVEIVKQVAHILHYAHTKGVVHRDVKPENIMLGPFGEVYLVDWGLAKIIGLPDPVAGGAPAEPVVAASGTGSSALTQAGGLVGTPLYMSPEQARGEPVSARSDIYSLAAVLYELVSLKHHLGGASESGIQAILDAIVAGGHAEAWTHYDETNGRVTRSLSLVCNRGLASSAGERFASAQELVGALDGCLDGKTPVLCPPTLLLWILNHWRDATVRHPAPVAFLTFVIPVLLALGWGGWRLWGALHG